MSTLLALLLLLASGADESEIVRSVRIEAPDPERLTRYVGLRVGEPYRPSAAREAVELIYATGDYEDVVVETSSRPDGLDIVLRTLPAPKFRRVRVEGDSVLGAGALRRLARLRPGEPLWPARLERAARETALALGRKGYLEATVTVTAERAGAGTSAADAAFHVHAGSLARVGPATIEPPDGPLAGVLRDLARPRPGEPFERAEAERAAETMRKRLVAAGRWRASVQFHETYDPGPARVTLLFTVRSGPYMTLEVRGARLPGNLRSQIVNLVRDGLVKADVLEEATERIERALRSEGYRDVTVRHHAEPSRSGEAVVFDVEPGPQATVGSVRVAGIPEVPAELQTRPERPLEERTLREDARALMRALEEEGYAEARAEAEAREGGGAIPVTFRVRPGPRTFVSAVAVEPPPPAGVELVELRTRAGRPYRVRDLAVDRSTVLAAYRNAGYLAVELTPQLDFSGDRSEVRVRLGVAPGPRSEVGEVVIAGLQRAREKVVRRELLLEEGGPLGLHALLESQRRLGTLGIFERVSINELDPEAGLRKDLVVEAREGRPTTLAYGIGYAERDLFRGSVEIARRNLSGMDRTVSAFARGSFRGSRLLLSFREPYFLGRKQELFVTGFREEENRDSFDFIRVGGIVQTAHTLSPRLSLILRYSYQETRVFNIEVPLETIDRQFRTYTLAGPSASLVNDTRDDPLDPRRGAFLGADVLLSERVLGGDSFLKAYFQAATYQRLGGRVVLALSGRLGLARTFGSGEPLQLPLPERFFAGGDYSLRGFKVDTVGPLAVASDGSLVPTGGNALVLGGAELRLDASRFLSVAVFSDVGNVYPLVSDLDLGDLRYTAGVGLRYKSALGPLRVDWGYKLNRRPGQSPYHVHVTVGHAF